MEKTPANATDRPLIIKNAWLFSSKCDVNCKIGKRILQYFGIEITGRVTYVHSEQTSEKGANP